MPEPDRTIGAVRAYVIKLIGKNGERGSVTFDRHGTNSAVFDHRTDQEALNHAVMNAINSCLRTYGPGWLDHYTVVTVGGRCAHHSHHPEPECDAAAIPGSRFCKPHTEAHQAREAADRIAQHTPASDIPEKPAGRPRHIHSDMEWSNVLLGDSRDV